MTLELEDREARKLRELLQDYLPQLKREVARTEAQPLRHEIVQRQELCEAMIARLALRSEGAGLSGSTVPAPDRAGTTRSSR